MRSFPLEQKKMIQNHTKVFRLSITLTSEANVDNSMNDAQRKINAILSDLPMMLIRLH
jgi:hypothetical protein